MTCCSTGPMVLGRNISTQQHSSQQSYHAFLTILILSMLSKPSRGLENTIPLSERPISSLPKHAVRLVHWIGVRRVNHIVRQPVFSRKQGVRSTSLLESGRLSP